MRAVVLADTTGLIQQWDDDAEAMFGYPPERAIGHSLDLLVPEHLRAAHWIGFHRAMRQPKVKDTSPPTYPYCPQTANSEPSSEGHWCSAISSRPHSARWRSTPMKGQPAARPTT